MNEDPGAGSRRGSGDPESKPEAAGAHAPGRVAACALLLEAAYADGQLDTEERARIESGLAEYFSIDVKRVRELVARTDQSRDQPADAHALASTLLRAYDRGQRRDLIELIWRVMLSDGALSVSEVELARRLGRLLELDPADMAAAIRRARAVTRRVSG